MERACTGRLLRTLLCSCAAVQQCSCAAARPPAQQCSGDAAFLPQPGTKTRCLNWQPLFRRVGVTMAAGQHPRNHCSDLPCALGASGGPHQELRQADVQELQQKAARGRPRAAVAGEHAVQGHCGDRKPQWCCRSRGPPGGHQGPADSCSHAGPLQQQQHAHARARTLAGGGYLCFCDRGCAPEPTSPCGSRSLLPGRRLGTP